MSDSRPTSSPRAGGGAAPAACTTGTCPAPNTWGSAITVNGSDDFRARTRQCLDTLNATPTGARMLRSIEASGHRLTFVESTAGNSASPTDAAAAQRRGDGTPGAGSDSTVRYNPNRTRVGDGSEPWMTRPPCIGLSHELVHAYHSANGTNDFTPAGEDMAVGVPPYDTNDVTENKIRHEWTPRQPARPHY